MKSADFKIMNINTKDIVVDDMGQRDVDRRKAQFHKIMRTFDQKLVQDIDVAYIDGKYYCINGQMTRKVLIAKNGGKDLNVRCRVFNGLTMMDAAMMFINQRGTEAPVDLADKIRVLANYGDKDACDFIRLTEANGLFIAWTKTRGKNSIVAVSTLFSIFKDFNNNDEYESFIRVIKAAWDGDPNSLRRKILSGMAHFYKCYYGKFDENRLVAKLSEVSPITIMRNAEVDQSTGARKYAYQIWLVYNKNGGKTLPNML